MMENKTITLDFRFHFTKRGIIITLTAFFLCWHPNFLGSETLTMTTYYPAPYGGYASLLTTGRTLLARDGDSVGIGTLTPGAKLDIKGLGNTAATFGFGMRNSDNTPIMVVRDDGNVGIGTEIPASRLQVAGGVQLGDDNAPCTAAKAGTQRWHAGAVEICNGTLWGAAAGGSLVRFGGTFFITGGRNNAGLTPGCSKPNVVTGGCTCPAGYSARNISIGAYYWWSPWDMYAWGYSCEAFP